MRGVRHRSGSCALFPFGNRPDRASNKGKQGKGNDHISQGPFPNEEASPPDQWITEAKLEERSKHTYLGRNYMQRFWKHNETGCPFQTQWSMPSFLVYQSVGHQEVVQ